MTDQRVLDLLQPHFDFDITNSVFYQYIGQRLGIHTDYGRKTVTNYVINTGGENVVTKWFSGSDVIFETIIEEKRWHKITVDIPHSVDNIQTDRYMLTFQQEQILMFNGTIKLLRLQVAFRGTIDLVLW
jgi:hypothetical protein